MIWNTEKHTNSQPNITICSNSNFNGNRNSFAIKGLNEATGLDNAYLYFYVEFEASYQAISLFGGKYLFMDGHFFWRIFTAVSSTR